MNRPTIIPSVCLQEIDLPPQNANWKKLARFALTFDPQEITVYGEKAASLRNASFSNSVPELRAHLYVEQRRWNHFGMQPDEDTLIELHQIIEWIRKKLIES